MSRCGGGWTDQRNAGKLGSPQTYNLHLLEDPLKMAADYLFAEVVAQRTMLMQPKSPMSLLIMT